MQMNQTEIALVSVGLNELVITLTYLSTEFRD